MPDGSWRAWQGLPDNWVALKAAALARDPFSDQVVNIIGRRDGETLALTCEDPLAFAVWTPGRRLLLGGMGATAARALAVELADEPLTGVAGYVPEVDVFRQQFLASGRHRAEAHKQLIFHQLGVLQPPPSCPGGASIASADDLELLLPWHHAFAAEADPSAPRPRNDQVRLAIAQRALWIWRDGDGEAVSFAGLWWPGSTSSRIGPVYTPPEHRRRGYASALVHACAERGQRAGRCTLFTDAANPTSNRIYRALGFEPGRHFQEWDFSPLRASA